MKKKKPTKVKRVKAWAVVHIRSLSPWGTPVETENVWQYPIFPGKKQAKSFIEQKKRYLSDEHMKIVPILLTYTP